MRAATFAAIGLTTALLPLAISLGLVLMGWHEQVAFLVAAILAIESNFALNALLTWRERTVPILQSWLRFHGWKLITVPLGQIVFFCAHAFLGGGLGEAWRYTLAYAITATLVALANFTVLDRLVFRRPA